MSSSLRPVVSQELDLESGSTRAIEMTIVQDERPSQPNAEPAHAVITAQDEESDDEADTKLEVKSSPETVSSAQRIQQLLDNQATLLDESQRRRRKFACYAFIGGTVLFTLAGGIAFILEKNARKNMQSDEDECRNFDFSAACEILTNNATALINTTGCALSAATDWCGNRATAAYERAAGIGLFVGCGVLAMFSSTFAFPNKDDKDPRLNLSATDHNDIFELAAEADIAAEVKISTESSPREIRNFLISTSPEQRRAKNNRRYNLFCEFMSERDWHADLNRPVGEYLGVDVPKQKVKKAG